MTLATEQEIQQAYQGQETASRYVGERFLSPLNRLLHEKQVRAVQRIIDRTRPEAVLEIAPGPGRVTRDICPPRRLVCLEFNEGMIAEGKAACGNHAEWVQGNAFELPFQETFNLVYSFRFVRHFHREDRERLYAQIRRVLKPGGSFVMDAVNTRVSKPLRDARPEDYPIYDVLYTEDELRRELTGAGLEPVVVEPVHKRYSLQHRSQVVLGPKANWLNRLVIHGLEKLPGGEPLEWVVTCRRG
jgi:ubiquinone/menaquinone biosynthesis C-methylase UbiE